MITNPQAKTILCYGDSNVWGQRRDGDSEGRYARDVRWTGRLQELLSDDYSVIEEGLGGRTTNLEHYNPDKLGRNGLTYFAPCLDSHSPLDMVVIMLGTNDLKMQYDRSVSEVVDTLKLFTDRVRVAAPAAKILLISPIHIDDTAPMFAKYYDGIYDAQSADKSRQLGKEIERVAHETGALFFDASTVAQAGRDGIHFDQQSHLGLAQALAGVIKDEL